MATPLYCAIIGDIDGSRLLKNRSAVQRRFKSAIGRINEDFKREIASRFLVTVGDEFQGLLRSPQHSLACLQRFRAYMGPVSFSYGIGVGTLSTALERISLGMDGEAFHRARAALAEAKAGDQHVVLNAAAPGTDLVNALLGIIEAVEGRLTDRQREIVAAADRFTTQQEIARHLGITQPAVSKVLSAPHVRQLRRSRAALTAHLARLGRK